jgi:hypothetical protein
MPSTNAVISGSMMLLSLKRIPGTVRTATNTAAVFMTQLCRNFRIFFGSACMIARKKTFLMLRQFAPENKGQNGIQPVEFPPRFRSPKIFRWCKSFT